MEKILIEIPDNIARSVKLPPGEVNKRLKQELALRLYDQGILTLGKARELAGISKWEFFKLLGKKEINRKYDLEELKKDIAILERMD